MGMILIKQELYPEAGAIYSQILSEDHYFPELHIRLSLTYYRTGDLEEVLDRQKQRSRKIPTTPPLT